MLVYVNTETGTVDQIRSNWEAVIVDLPDGDYADRYFENGDYADDIQASVIPLPLVPEDDDDRKVADSWAPQMPITLTENEPWYVRSMVARGIQSIRDQLEEQAKLAHKAANDGTTPKWAVDMLENAAAYSRQLLHEAEQFIPKGLQ